MLTTVLTPTWNRAQYLTELYDSLILQEVDIEWLVVDDGSTDHTADLITTLARRAPFPVRYVRQANAGKLVAVNWGVSLARGELIAQLDSDDLLVAGALERLLGHWREIGDHSAYFGVVGLCRTTDGAVVGDVFPHDPLDASWHEAVYKFRIRGEKWGLLRTDVLRSHLFPETGGFVPENTVWRSIGHHYRTRYVNEIVRVYRQGASNQLTKSRFADNAAGAVVDHEQTLTDDLAWLRYHPTRFLRAAVHLNRGMFHLGRHSFAPFPMRARTLMGLTLPLGWFLYRRDLMARSA